MAFLLHETLLETAAKAPDAELLIHDKAGCFTADQFVSEVVALSAILVEADVERDDRVAVYLPKLPLTAFSFYAASMTGIVFVPVNPVLKAAQVIHILKDCDVRVLITSGERLRQLSPSLHECTALRHVVLSDPVEDEVQNGVTNTIWQPRPNGSQQAIPRTSGCRIDNDMAAILYTSGSTGRPKGVVVSHRNVVVGAASVAEYLGIDARDRLLAVLPFSFDYGLNQLTSAVLRGAACILFDYLLPRDVVKAVERHRITGLAAVPPL